MEIFVNSGDRETRGVNPENIQNEVRNTLVRFQDRITRVEVHLKDVNGPKSGNDKQCTIEARPAGMDPVVVTSDAEDLWTAITDAARKLQRKLQNDFEKKRPH